MESHNKHYFSDGTELEIIDKFDPNRYSLEMATVYLVNTHNKYLKAGDKVLVDFCIFSAGRYEEMQMSKDSRFMMETDGKFIYWASDGTDHNSTEIFGVIRDGEIFPAPGLVFITPQQKETTCISNSGLILIKKDDRDLSPFWTEVTFSSNRWLTPGTKILCEPGMSIPVRLKGQDLEYINLQYIIGKQDQWFILCPFAANN